MGINLAALKLKVQHEKFQGQSDLYVGMMTALVAHEDVTKTLDRQASRFRDRFLIAVPADEDLSKCNWDGQGHLARKLFIQKSHLLFSGNPGTREFGLGRKHPSVQEFVNEFKSLKPCIHGSDSHSYDSLFMPKQGRHLWVKADPTFEGLRQLLHEPESRIFLGDLPPSVARVAQNATKFMTEVSFDRTASAKQGENWFSGSIPLNHGLIAIIGNKGSGKSALADILALLGDTHAWHHFSFLIPERFLAPKTQLGAMFRAKVTWRSGRVVPRLLSDSVDPTVPELLKYIPQNYLETICSELKESSETGFDRELMEVIFSHVGEAERLGMETLPDLIGYLTNEKEERISQVQAELADVNAMIVALEDQLTEEYRKSIEAQLNQRRAELKAHGDAKPAEVKEPEQDPVAQAATKGITDELAGLQLKLEGLETGLTNERERLREAALQVAAADKLLTRIANLERQVINFYAESGDDGRVLGLDVKGLVVLKTNRQPILDAKESAEERSRAARTALDVQVADSLAAQRRKITLEIEAKRLQLDEPNRRYQNYLQQLADWERKQNEIEGSADNGNSVRGLEAKLVP